MTLLKTPAIVLGAAVSFLLLFLFFSADLSKRLGGYFLAFSVAWVFSTLVASIIAGKLLPRSHAKKIGLACFFISYASGVLAYFIIVVLDINNVKPNQTFDIFHPKELLIPIFGPFLTLNGWMHALLFASISMLIDRFSSK
jgi:hypothetical protein